MSSSFTFLTADDIARLQMEQDDDLASREQIDKRISDRAEKLKAAMLFATPGFDLRMHIQRIKEVKRLPETETKAPRLDTWIGVVHTCLMRSERGLTRAELLEMAKKAAPHLQVSAGEKGFYTAIAKLEKRTELLKVGSLLYSAAALQKMKDRGEQIPTGGLPRGGSSHMAILEVLGQHPDGLTGPQLREALLARKDVPESMRNHGQYMYNMLKTLLDNEQVVKDEKLYKIAHES